MPRFLKLLVLRYLPPLAKMAFRAKRLKEDKAYWSTFAASKEVRGGGTKEARQPRLLIVLPRDYNLDTPFVPAAGNYNYEIARSAEERYGTVATEVYFPSQKTDWITECRKIVEKVEKAQITHFLFYIESLEVQSSLWRWDILAAELARIGSEATAIGFLTDGTYELHQVQCSRFHDLYPKSLFVQIDVVPGTKYLPHERIVGPTFLPISLESISHLKEYLSKSQGREVYELSFIGKMYGYRKKIVRKLVARGLEIRINPHCELGSGIKATYPEYMSALSRSKYTINFSRANGTRQKQLKSRVLESLLVGSIPITDDNDLSRRYIPERAPVITFNHLNQIQSLKREFEIGLANSSLWFKDYQIGLDEINRFASSCFWETLEEGLCNGNLPMLVPKPTP